MIIVENQTIPTWNYQLPLPRTKSKWKSSVKQGRCQLRCGWECSRVTISGNLIRTMSSSWQRRRWLLPFRRRWVAGRWRCCSQASSTRSGSCKCPPIPTVGSTTLRRCLPLRSPNRTTALSSDRLSLIGRICGRKSRSCRQPGTFDHNRRRRWCGYRNDHHIEDPRTNRRPSSESILLTGWLKPRGRWWPKWQCTAGSTSFWW